MHPVIDPRQQLIRQRSRGRTRETEPQGPPTVVLKPIQRLIHTRIHRAPRHRLTTRDQHPKAPHRRQRSSRAVERQQIDQLHVIRPARAQGRAGQIVFMIGPARQVLYRAVRGAGALCVAGEGTVRMAKDDDNTTTVARVPG
jgi:hypothetical protein